MGSQVNTHDDANENKENEFIDFIVSSSVVGGLFFVIFIIVTIVKMVM